MCYSATASFTASTVLAVMGLALILRTQNKRFLPLALFPWLFAIQQAAEGFVWLGLAPDFAKNLFLFFALVGWPLWVPFAFWFAEKRSWSKQTLAICFGVGLVISSLLGFSIPNMTASTTCSSVHYVYPTHFYNHNILFVSYAIATVFPFFLSSLPKTAYLGLLFAASALLIAWIDRTFFISLWCFVSAMISLGLFFILRPHLHSQK